MTRPDESRPEVSQSPEDLLEALEADPSLDPALRESLRLSCRMHAGMVAASSEEPTTMDETAAAIPDDSGPTSRRQRVSHYPLAFRLRLLRWPLRFTAGACATWLLAAGVLLLLCWNGLGEVGRPIGTLLWVAGLGALVGLAPRYLDGKVPFPEAQGLSRLVMAFLIPVALGCAAFLATAHLVSGLAVFAVLAVAGGRLHRDVTRHLQPDAAAWLAMIWVPYAGLMLAAVWLRQLPALGCLLTVTWYWYANHQRERALTPAVLSEARGLIRALLASHALTLAGLFLLLTDRGQGAVISGISVLLAATLLLNWCRAGSLPLRFRFMSRLVGRGIALTSGIATTALLLSLLDPLAFGLTAVCVSGLVLGVSWRHRSPWMLLPGLLLSAVGYGMVLRQVLRFEDGPGAAALAVGFLPYMAGVQALLVAAHNTGRRIEALMLSVWGTLTMGALAFTAHWLGSPIAAALVLAGVGLAMFATGLGRHQRVRAVLGALTVLAGVLYLLSGVSWSMAASVNLLAPLLLGMLLLAAVLVWRRRQRSVLAAAALIDAASLGALGLLLLALLPVGWLGPWSIHEPFSQAMLAVVLTGIGLAFGRIDISLLATLILARATHGFLLEQAHEHQTALRFVVFAACGGLPVVLHELHQRLPHLREGPPGPAPTSAFLPLAIFFPQLFTGVSWATLGTDTTVTSAAVGGWILLATVLFLAGLRCRRSLAFYLAAVPLTAAAWATSTLLQLPHTAAHALATLVVVITVAFLVNRQTAARSTST